MIRLLYISMCLLFPLWGSRSAGSLQAPTEQLMGMDISHHQKEIEWDTVAASAHLHFAFVKATEGSDFSDSLFCYNWESLQRLGIRRGAYHFFRAYGCGYDQAMHFLQTVELQPGDLAPVLDIETTDGMPPEILLEEARVWLQTVEYSLQVKPIIYTNQNFYEKYLSGVFDHYPLWIARYSDQTPILTNGKRWDFWQYSNEGCIDGISKKVDLNVFSGSPESLETLCWFPEQNSAPAPAAP